MNAYEKRLNFNRILSWIHSLRYKQTIKILQKLYTKDSCIKITELGCANAKMFEVLKLKFSNIQYVGVEPYIHFYNEAKEKYKYYENFKIFNMDAEDYLKLMNRKDCSVIICLETLEHISHEKVLRIIKELKRIKPFLFLSSFPIEIGLSVLMKNIVSFIFGYHRHKKLYTWKETFWATLYRLDKLPSHDCTHKAFDYRKLTKELKNKAKIYKEKMLPKILPKWIANSIYVIVKW